MASRGDGTISNDATDVVAGGGATRAPESGTPPVGRRDSEVTAETLGERIRTTRLGRDMKARDLATRAEVTPGFISQLERGSVLPSIPTLLRIAAALEVTPSWLFEPTPRTGRLLRHGERNTYSYKERGFREAILSADEHGIIELMWAMIEPGGGTGDELFTHGTLSECVYVLSGELEVRVDTEVYVLRAGDCLTFPGTLPHGCTNRGTEPSEHLWITSPAVY